MKLRVAPGTALPLCVWLVGATMAIGAGLYSPAELWASVRGLLPVAAAVLLHEAGHAVVARLCGVHLDGLWINLFGARLRLHGMLSYGRELMIAAAGPAVNLLAAALVLGPTLRRGGDALAQALAGGDAQSLFVVASVGLAAVNLLPVRSMDGGRILRCGLSLLFGERIADAVLTVCTALCLGALWCLSVYALLRVGEMLTLFGFSLCLLLRMTEGGRRGAPAAQ